MPSATHIHPWERPPYPGEPSPWAPPSLADYRPIPGIRGGWIRKDFAQPSPVIGQVSEAVQDLGYALGQLIGDLLLAGKLANGGR